MGSAVSSAVSACGRAVVKAAKAVAKAVVNTVKTVVRAVKKAANAVWEWLNEDLGKGRTRRPWVLGAGCAAMVIVAAPLAVMGLGFLPAGIAAGSAAASMMSFFAGSAGIASGSLVAICQSIGATGMLSFAQASILGMVAFFFGSQL
mmetsp:Transcript_18678/g.44987  ORF Transcript_18678/g.44987 Transcript_18678/m.44987 type:complete len:147 (-) Transcript_18678:100-540(-)